MSVSQSRGSFDSGGKIVGYDAFIPGAGNGSRFPAVIGLHGSAGGHATMIDPAAMLAAQGFAVYVLHYFDRTGTTGVADKQTAIRNFQPGEKPSGTRSATSSACRKWIPIASGSLGSRWALILRSRCPRSIRA